MTPRRNRPSRRPTRDESGFTLAELLVSIAIETVVFVALATAFVVVLNSGTSVNESLSKSADARFAAQYIVSDARNSSGPEISLTDTTSCSDPNPPVVGTVKPVARFNWNTPSQAGTTTASTASYVLVNTSLLRRHCENGTLVSDAELAQDVASVIVTCAPIADCTGTPSSITVAITETPNTAAGPAYAYSLTATFRKLIGGGSSLAPAAPHSVIVLGSGGSCGTGATGITLTGSGKLRVYGDLFINTADGASCKALSISNGAPYQAGSTSILAGGTCFAGGGSVCPTATSYSPALGDPYAGLVVPSTTGLSNQAGCPSGKAQPGIYASSLTFGSSDCELQPGIYILRAGFALGSGAHVTTAPGGVLIYLTGGTFDVGGGASLTLTAKTTGPYAGLALWQAAADTSTITFSNGGALVFNGTIYAPRAQLNITGNAQTPVATAIVVQTLVITNSGAISVGASPTPLSISAPATLPAWTVDQPYPSTTLTAAGGDGSYTWSATGLPNGMAIGAGSGVISGTPTAAGAASVTVTLNDALGDDPDSHVYTLSVNGAPAISTASPLPGGEKTVPYTTTLASSGGTAPLTWSATGLPAGLAINASTGVISGTPTAAGTSAITVTLSDAANVSVSKNLTLVVAPQATVVSVTLANGPGTAGTIDAGDKITVVFSAQMSVSSFCGAWSGDSSDQSLSAKNDVVVSISNAATDVLTVTSAVCGPFNFGSINLASGAYVSSAATFKGSSSSASRIAWTASTNTLVITLGTKTSGSVASVSTSTPIYTASPAIRDSAGGVLANSPFTLPAGRKF